MLSLSKRTCLNIAAALFMLGTAAVAAIETTNAMLAIAAATSNKQVAPDAIKTSKVSAETQPSSK